MTRPGPVVVVPATVREVVLGNCLGPGGDVARVVAPGVDRCP